VLAAICFFLADPALLLRCGRSSGSRFRSRSPCTRWRRSAFHTAVVFGAAPWWHAYAVTWHSRWCGLERRRRLTPISRMHKPVVGTRAGQLARITYTGWRRGLAQREASRDRIPIPHQLGIDDPFDFDFPPCIKIARGPPVRPAETLLAVDDTNRSKPPSTTTTTTTQPRFPSGAYFLMLLRPWSPLLRRRRIVPATPTP
jgi:hypothetical protein